MDIGMATLGKVDREQVEDTRKTLKSIGTEPQAKLSTWLIYPVGYGTKSIQLNITCLNVLKGFSLQSLK